MNFKYHSKYNISAQPEPEPKIKINTASLCTNPRNMVSNGCLD